ncbi:MAG: hypothetical protein IJU66_06170 [Oscillospiraceae bacterium]|nr:hypothetical protein [Oscillospiraceae bacterium]
MADWQEQLNTILSDPDAMAQIVSLAQSISGNQGEPADEKPPPQGERSAPSGSAQDPLGAMLGGLDPELTRRLVPLLAQLNRTESSETTALLLALRPFLSEKRREKVERAAQLARLIHLGKLFFTSQEQEGQRV